MIISYEESIETIDYIQLNTVLGKIFESKKTRDVFYTQTVFENSQNVVFAFDNSQLIGVIRAISDGDWAVIYDFGVLKEYEDTEVKKEILSRLIKQLKGQHIFTNAVPGTIAFYEQNGFQRTKTAFTYVGFEQNESRSTEYFLPVGYRFENEFYEVEFPFAPRHLPKKKRKVALSYHTSRKAVDYQRVNEIIRRAFGEEQLQDLDVEEVAKTKQLFENSQYVSFAYDGDRLVGVARAITDRLEEAYVQNVAVDPEYQGHGIGWQVTVTLCEEILKDGLNPFLHTHPGAVGFYNRTGFLRNKTALDYRGKEENSSSIPTAVEQGFYLPTGYRFIDETVL
ncbi:GNAT family N-acetyltransferase [Enterococcus olivae]